MAVDYAGIEMVELLLKAGANVQADKNYALKIAIKRRWTELYNLLESFGADTSVGMIIY